MFWANGITEVQARRRRRDCATRRPPRAGLRTGDEIVSHRRRRGRRPARRRVRAARCDERRRRRRARRARQATARRAPSRSRSPTRAAPQAHRARRLFRGLGFDFWEPPRCRPSGEVIAGRPGREGRPASGRPHRRDRRRSRSAISATSSEHDRSAEPGETLTIRYRRGGARAQRARHAVATTADGKHRRPHPGRASARQPGISYPDEHAPAHRPRRRSSALERARREGLEHDGAAGAALRGACSRATCRSRI